jgi:hypothetical protein
MDGGTIVATADIDNCSIANGKRSAGCERQRGLYRPAGSQLLVVVDRNAGRVVAARGYDAGVIQRGAVEPQPAHVHGWAGGPTVGNRVEDLRDRHGRWEHRASKQIEFPLVHRAARSCYGRWHRRSAVNAPSVSRDVIDLQLGPFAGAVVTAGNV